MATYQREGVAAAEKLAAAEAEDKRRRRGRLVITMTGYRRPNYQRTVLDALAKCHGIEDWVLVPHVEPDVEEVVASFDDWSACEIRKTINPKRLGLNLNTQAAMRHAMKLSPAVLVHLEDDTVPSPDALLYFEWAVTEILANHGKDLILASGYNKPEQRPPDRDRFVARTRPIWTPWGWAVDHKRLIWLVAQWCTKNPKCFTCRIKDSFKRTRREVFPVLSRVQNIGYQKGENDRSPEWYRANHRTPFVAGELPPGEFKFQG